MGDIVEIAKMNGLGNKIIIVNMCNTDEKISSNSVLNLSKKISFDQMMVIHDAIKKNIDYNIKIFNRDGSLAKSCGNGIRCVVEWLFYKKKKIFLSLI